MVPCKIGDMNDPLNKPTHVFSSQPVGENEINAVECKVKEIMRLYQNRKMKGYASKMEIIFNNYVLLWIPTIPCLSIAFNKSNPLSCKLREISICKIEATLLPRQGCVTGQTAQIQEPNMFRICIIYQDLCFFWFWTPLTEDVVGWGNEQKTGGLHEYWCICM